MKRILKLSIAGSIACALVGAVAAQGPEKPNIIVIYTDDHGYADLSCQGVFDDVKTPNIDSLALGGVRMTDGYSTAPQCGPSRTGLISGQYQTKFGLDNNKSGHEALERFRALDLLPKKMKRAGYATGMAGKSHLGSNDSGELTKLGFDQVFFKHSNAPGHWNMNLAGEDIEPQVHEGGYHLDLVSEFACTFIERFKDQPFFFYAAYRAPHVPLDATPKYLNRFPGEMPERRRQALAMLSAVDDGVGTILATLRKNGLEENTLIFVIGDNGAPLKLHKLDAMPITTPGWDGSLNDPLNGEKGTLIDGGMRVPFVVYWKDTIPAGQVYSHPVISLDVAATANALAGLPDDADLDGVNLIPYLSGQKTGAPHEALFWRWMGQYAIRKGPWKFLTGGGRDYLFNVEEDIAESNNLMKHHPEQAQQLRDELEAWSKTLMPEGIDQPLPKAGHDFFDWYLEGKRGVPAVNAPKKTPKKEAKKAGVSSEELFERRDKDQDGNVTLEEYLTGRTGSVAITLENRFKERDTDHDGVWEKSEL